MKSTASVPEAPFDILYTNEPPVSYDHKWERADFDKPPQGLDTFAYTWAYRLAEDLVLATTIFRAANMGKFTAQVQQNEDPRIWYQAARVTQALFDYELMLDLLKKIDEKMTKMNATSGFIRELYRRVNEFVQMRARIIQASTSPESAMSHKFSSIDLHVCELPGTPHFTEKIICRLPLVAKKIEISRLLRYISLDTQRLEGELSQIPASRPGLTQSLLTLGFTEASLQHLDIEDRDYVLPTLESTYQLNKNYVEANLSNFYFTKSQLIELHSQVVRYTRSTVVHAEG
ncbi:hypothetical protein BDD12DRAFT_810404, partial [Trichophaea hybrida]